MVPTTAVGVPRLSFSLLFSSRRTSLNRTPHMHNIAWKQEETLKTRERRVLGGMFSDTLRLNHTAGDNGATLLTITGHKIPVGCNTLCKASGT